MKKTAIAVYNPQDRVEQAFQDAYHRMSGKWLTAGQLKVITRCIPLYRGLINKVKINVQKAANLLFGEKNDTDQWYYPCDIMELRVVLEEQQIAWHTPIVLFSRKAAYRLMNEYPICLVFDRDVVKTGRIFGSMVVMDSNRLFLGKSLKHVMIRTYLGKKQLDTIENIVEDAYGHIPTYLMHEMPGMGKAASGEIKMADNWYTRSKGPKDTFDKDFLIGELPKTEIEQEGIEKMDRDPTKKTTNWSVGDRGFFRYDDIDLNANGGAGSKTQHVPVRRSIARKPVLFTVQKVDEENIHILLDGNKKEQKIPIGSTLFLTKTQ